MPLIIHTVACKSSDNKPNEDIQNNRPIKFVLCIRLSNTNLNNKQVYNETALTFYVIMFLLFLYSDFETALSWAGSISQWGEVPFYIVMNLHYKELELSLRNLRIVLTPCW
jgi:hypothetical protein